MGGRCRLADDVVTAIRHAATDLNLRASIAELYARLDAEITAAAPVCNKRGACCKFDAFGHLLFVTPAELAFFASGASDAEMRFELPSTDNAPAATSLRVLSSDASRSTPHAECAAPSERCCPYQVDGLCTARERRPLGCRVFFCDADSQEWQPPLYERYLTELKRIGAVAGLPYQYVEWLSALQQVEGSAVDATGRV